jgi:uroporphyrinogen III methyltransferase / synthase
LDKKGIVYLVGAGPGDYKLISVRGLEYLEQADAVVYDRLADPRLLQHVRPDAEMIYVGKASSQHTMKQGDINQLLVDLAKQGKVVVRLKGGDPFVFGRGGEEALELVKNGLPFEVVPGITSAIAVPAYAGIPVTHRGVATSFAVITGHEDPTKSNSTMRWDKLATGVDTLAFLMGVENLPYITKKLQENGRLADTPAAIIRWGTKPEQRTVLTTVGKAAEDAVQQHIQPPAIFLVGDVCALRNDLAWFDQKLLFGKKILVTRAREQASALTSQLEALGAQCLEAPVIKIAAPDSYVLLDESIQNLSHYDWIIFTSVNGVTAFFDRLTEAGLDARALAANKVAAIGSQTAEKLRGQGIVADLVPMEFRAEGIVEALGPELTSGMKVLIPRALVARDLLPQKLIEMGVDAHVVPAYKTIAAETDGAAIAAQLKQGEIDLVTFTSSSTVMNLLQLLGPAGKTLISQIKVACIGPITAETCLKQGVKPDIIAKQYTIKGLVSAISTYYEEGQK